MSSVSSLSLGMAIAGEWTVFIILLVFGLSFGFYKKKTTTKQTNRKQDLEYSGGRSQTKP